MMVSHKIRLCRMPHKKENFLRKCYGSSRYAYNQAKELSDVYYKEIGKSLSKQALRNKFRTRGEATSRERMDVQCPKVCA